MPRSANLSSFAVGTTLGWTAPISPKLKDPSLTDSPLSAVPTTDEFAWIGSLVALAAFIGKPLTCWRPCITMHPNTLFAVAFGSALRCRTAGRHHRPQVDAVEQHRVLCDRVHYAGRWQFGGSDVCGPLDSGMAREQHGRVCACVIYCGGGGVGGKPVCQANLL